VTSSRARSSSRRTRFAAADDVLDAGQPVVDGGRVIGQGVDHPERHVEHLILVGGGFTDHVGVPVDAAVHRFGHSPGSLGHSGLPPSGELG
jgi:hypothetical protein